MLSVILKAKQKLGVTFNSDKLGIIRFSKKKFAQKKMDLWDCFWGPAHGHIWKFRKINDVLLIEIENYT